MLQDIISITCQSRTFIRESWYRMLSQLCIYEYFARGTHAICVCFWEINLNTLFYGTLSSIDLKQYNLNRRFLEKVYDRLWVKLENCTFGNFSWVRILISIFTLALFILYELHMKVSLLRSQFDLLVQDYKLMPYCDITEKTVTSELHLDWSVCGCCLA
jgi:hypothetical protein